MPALDTPEEVLVSRQKRAPFQFRARIIARTFVRPLTHVGDEVEQIIIAGGPFATPIELEQRVAGSSEFVPTWPRVAEAWGVTTITPMQANLLDGKP